MLFKRPGRTTDASEAFLAFAEYCLTSATLNDAGLALMRGLKKAKQTLRQALDRAMEDAKEESDEKGALADAVWEGRDGGEQVSKAEKEER
jgi:hypothetical protein